MLKLFQEISVEQADLIKSFAIFYLLLVGNHVSPTLFTCFQVNYIKNHKWLQFVIAFFLFYFLVTLVSNTGNLKFTPPIEKLMYSLFYFLGFLVLMRLDIFITFIVLLLVFIIYFLELNKEYYLEKGKEIHDPLDQTTYNSNQYWITLNWPIRVRLFPVKDYDFHMFNKLERILYYLIIILLVLGFISYGGEVHDTVTRSKHLTWVDVISDTSVCKLKNRKSFWHYLKVGLGIQM